MALDGRARRWREGLSCCSREDGEHRCRAGAAAANSGAVLSLFLWSAMRGSVSHERLSACCALVGAPYGLLELKGNRPCPRYTPKCDEAAAQAGGLGRLPRRASPVRALASRRTIRPEKRIRGRVVSATRTFSCLILQDSSLALRAAPTRARAAQISVLRAVGAKLSRADSSWPRAPQREITPRLCESSSTSDAQQQPWRRRAPCASWPSSPRR